MRRQRSTAFDVEALLESERGIPAIPTDLRSRAVRRARRAVGDGRPASIVAARPARLRWAIAAASVLVLGALATAAIQRRPRQVLPTIPDAEPNPPANAASAHIAAPETDLTSFEPPPRSRAGRPVRRVLTQAEEYARELRLLQPAREAIARDDFDSALAATAAHERRFPHGQLVEEREALRIVALAGTQRGADARIAAAAFHQWFPNSLLQKRVDDALRGLP